MTVTDADVRLAHMVDDYEKLVTGDLRMLTQFRDLLADAQHANQHGRTAVVDEFIDRTRRAMTDRIDVLQARGA